MHPLIIATRKSMLAMWQAEYVQKKLKEIYPQVEILGLSTKGDEVLDKSLSKIGGKGLFTKELEDAMYRGDAHLAVHSLKDVPMELPILDEPFLLGAILARDDVRDAFVSNNYNSLDELPDGAIVGTSSLRRSSIIKHFYPKLNIKMLRGNVNTRLAKLDNNEYDAIILASAGLNRLGLESRIKQNIPIEKMLPAPAQGALGIEIYGQKYLDIIQKLNDKSTQLACMAEREVSLCLGGSCHVPLAGYAYFDNDLLILKAQVISIDGKKIIESTQSAVVKTLDEAKNLGKLVSSELINQGAIDIINQSIL